MSKLPLRLAAASLIVGGPALGAAPMPLSDYGCRAALGPSDLLDQSTEVVLACADARSERQSVVGLLLTMGAAGLAASLAPRRPEAGAADGPAPAPRSASRGSST